jgi:hypothetical protein
MTASDKSQMLKSAGKTIRAFAAAIGLGFFLLGCTSTHNAVSQTPTAPCDAMVIRHTVADYSKWKPAFDADAAAREAAGIHAVGVARGMEDPNDIEIPSVIDDVQKAKAFSTDPRLKDVMQQAGVTSAPDIKFIHVLRFTDTGKGDYAEVVVNVKDFDAWLKVFDSEGPATRKTDGLTDMVLGHGIDDPNLVYLVFKINSVAEAKAALTTNSARQKLMQESGVEGKPTIYFGSDQ